MHRAPEVSRPAWMRAFPGNADGVRRSPVEIVANMASYVTRTPVADLSGLRGGWFGRWTDGVVAMRGDCIAFASHWQLLKGPVRRWRLEGLLLLVHMAGYLTAVFLVRAGAAAQASPGLAATPKAST